MLIVSGAYCFSIFIGADTKKMSFSPINPAVAVGLIAASVLDTDWQSNFACPFCVFPYVGALVGVCLYEFLYKRAVDAVGHD